MRKWQNLAPPDDPNSWYDVDGFWPNLAGHYESVQFLDSGTTFAATGTGDVIYAFVANTVSSSVENVVTSTQIWQRSGATVTDLTGGVAIGTAPFMAQYGNVTICAMGNATATAKSTGPGVAFSALAGAPKAEIALVVANVVLMLNTDTSADGWAASDVGDYTNWTTGDSASGRLLQTPGPITAGVSFGNYAIVFKGDAIYRMTYVGGVVKWTTELVYRGIGCTTSSFLGTSAKYCAKTGSGNILFPGYTPPAVAADGTLYYLFDGVSPPKLVNEYTDIPGFGQAFYNPQRDLFTIAELSNGVFDNVLYFYCPRTDMWGKYTLPSAGFQRMPLLGDFSAQPTFQSSMPTLWGKSATNTLKRYLPGFPTGSSYVGTCYVRTSLIGAPEQKTTYRRLIPRYRKRYSLTSPSVTSSFSFYGEAYLTGIYSGLPAVSQTITPSESSTPYRFDFTATDNFGQFKVIWTNIFIEIDDVLVVAVPAGKQ